jgi:hypothetical protein
MRHWTISSIENVHFRSESDQRTTSCFSEAATMSQRWKSWTHFDIGHLNK